MAPTGAPRRTRPGPVVRTPSPPRADPQASSVPSTPPHGTVGAEAALRFLSTRGTCWRACAQDRPVVQARDLQLGVPDNQRKPGSWGARGPPALWGQDSEVSH